MYNLNDIGLSKQHREDVARQVEYNRLSRQLRTARFGTSSGMGNTLLKRVFALSPRKEQTAEC